MDPNWNDYRTSDDVRLQDLEDEAEFSREVENWHNFVHNNPAYPEIMNPTTNIWTWRFWALHHRIDHEFIAMMGRNGIGYDNIDHSTV